MAVSYGRVPRAPEKASQVITYRATDGSVFETEVQAERHSDFVKLRDYLKDECGEVVGPISAEALAEIVLKICNID